MTGVRSLPVDSLVNLCLNLLARQRDALIRRELSAASQCGEALTETLALLRGAVVREGTDPETLKALRHQLRINRVLITNALTVAEHFVSSLAPDGGTSILLSEQV